MIVRRAELFDRLMDASSIGRWLGRPRTTVRKYCQQIACDVASHRPLYSLRQCASRLECVGHQGTVKRVA